MSLESALTKAQTSVPECVSAGYVDMSTGMLLGVKTVDSHPAEVLDLVAAATADLFQGQSVRSIAKLFRKSRGQREDGHNYFQEIIVFSDNLLHVLCRSKKYPDQAAVFVCRNTANIGMVLTKARMSITDLENSI